MTQSIFQPKGSATEPAGLSVIQRYVRLEKLAGFAGDWQRAQSIATQVVRACHFYGYQPNPY